MLKFNLNKINSTAGLLLVPLILAFGPHGKQKTEATGTPKVFLEELKQTEISEKSIYYGHLSPSNQANVYAPLDSTVEKLAFEIGDRVKKGQNIAILKPVGLDIGRNLIYLNAPTTGIILEQNFVSSELAKKNSVIIKIYRPGEFRSVINVTRDDLKYVKLTKKAYLFGSDNDQSIEVKGISHKVDTATGTQEVYLGISKQLNLRPGTLSKFFFKHNERLGYMVPQSAIKNIADKHFIQTIDSMSKVKNIDITVGYKDGNSWEISSQELSQGLKFVAKSSAELSIAQKVEIIEQSAAKP